jgi:hypothetical protein
VTQAADVTSAAEEGLENAQVVSVGRKPVPLIAISKPTRPDLALSTITGSAVKFGMRRVAAENVKTQRRIEAGAILKSNRYYAL